MALSEDEEHVLEQIEQSLYRNDPLFAHRVRLSSVRYQARSLLAFSVLGCLAGVGLMLLFCITTSVAVGVAGFVVLFVSLYVLCVIEGPKIEERVRHLVHSDPANGPVDV